MKLIRFLSAPAQPRVAFCDRCGSVCDEGCRTDALREQARDMHLRFGGRF